MPRSPCGCGPEGPGIRTWLWGSGPPRPIPGAGDEVVIILHSREDDHGNCFPLRMSADHAHECDAIHFRHHQVQQNQIGCLRVESCICFLAVGCFNGLKAFKLEKRATDSRASAASSTTRITGMAVTFHGSGIPIWMWFSIVVNSLPHCEGFVQFPRSCLTANSEGKDSCQLPEKSHR